jgi:hypothetical protein
MMNPKNALFLAASLTAFILAVLFGVVTKVTNNSTQAASAANASQEVIAAQNTAIPTLEQPTDLPTATAQSPLTAEEATMLAAAAIGREDAYSVETTTYQGLDSYKVVFSSGDVVYIGLDKEVLAKTKLQATVITVDPTSTPKKNRRSDDSGGNNDQPPSVNPPNNDDGGGEHDDGGGDGGGEREGGHD